MVEPHPTAGHDASVLAKKLIDAIEAHLRAHGGRQEDIARAADMSPSQLSNIKREVGKDPAYVIKSDVAERLAAAIGYEVTLTPKGGAS